MWHTAEPHPRDTSFWGVEFGIDRTEDEARALLAQEVAEIDSRHVFVMPSKGWPGLCYLYCHCRLLKSDEVVA